MGVTRGKRDRALGLSTSRMMSGCGVRGECECTQLLPQCVYASALVGLVSMIPYLPHTSLRRRRKR